MTDIKLYKNGNIESSELIEEKETDEICLFFTGAISSPKFVENNNISFNEYNGVSAKEFIERGYN